MDGIRFRLNGEEQCYEGSAADRLLDVLRDTFRMTSVKCGCKEGECGACAVLMDGRLVNSCCVAMGAAEGAEIVTLEGYRKTDRFRFLTKPSGRPRPYSAASAFPAWSWPPKPFSEKIPIPRRKKSGRGSQATCAVYRYNAIVKAIDLAAKEGNGLW